MSTRENRCNASCDKVLNYFDIVAHTPLPIFLYFYENHSPSIVLPYIKPNESISSLFHTFALDSHVEVRALYIMHEIDCQIDSTIS